MRARAIVLAASLPLMLAVAAGPALASSGNSAQTGELLHVGANPSTCDAGAGGPVQGFGQIQSQTQDGTVRVNLQIRNGLPNTTYFVDIRCVGRIGTYTTNPAGNGHFMTTLPAAALPAGQYYLDTAAPAPSGGLDTYVSTPFQN